MRVRVRVCVCVCVCARAQMCVRVCVLRRYGTDIGFYNYADQFGNSEYDALPSSYGDYLDEFD